jgi:hypothetical protein
VVKTSPDQNAQGQSAADPTPEAAITAALPMTELKLTSE